MKKATKPYQTIYITSFISDSIQDGKLITFMAVDEFQGKLFPPKACKVALNEIEYIGTLVEFFNGINENYNRNKHAQSTNYIVDITQSLHPIISGMIMSEDNLIYNPEKVKTIFAPILLAFENHNS